MSFAIDYTFKPQSILMKHLLSVSLVLLGLHAPSLAQYSLTVEASPAVTAGLTKYRFYVNMQDPSDRMSAVYGNDQASLEVNTPDGAFNSTFNSSWNASGINPAFLPVVPDLADDTYATVGLDGPASTSGFAGAADPSVVEDPLQPITPYFLTDGALSLESNTLIGASWYVLNTAANGLPDASGRVLIMQVTTGGAISGQVNYQVFPLGVGADQLQLSVPFSGAGDFSVPGGDSGCTDINACNYDAAAVTSDGTCTYAEEFYDCEGNCLSDSDGDGVCDELEVVGCDEVLACNYDQLVTENDGSCDFCSCSGSGEELAFPLIVEANPAVAVEGATTYRFYVQMSDASDRMSAVFGNSSDTLIVSTPSGAFNSSASTTWNASVINPAFLDLFPDVVDDTYATIGLTGPASASGLSGASDPSIVGEGVMTPFFLNNESPGLEVNDLIGGSWFVLSDASNGLPDADLRVLIMQVTTTGSISGKLNYQVFDGGLGENDVNVSATFDGAGAYGTGGNACGCTNESASNFDPQAQFDDGSCEEGVSGCTVSAACNYNPEATIDDGSCDFVSCLSFGCTDPGACNYDPTAQFDDGSCDYITCLGCTDPSACNYDATATIAGTCDYDSCGGCTDETASNYDPAATLDDGSCEFPGCTIPQACNFDANANVNDGSCDFESCLNFGCINELACNYDPDADIPDSSCIFPGSACDDGDDATINDVIGDDCVCSGVAEVGGCTNPSACNYDASATTDDGSCEFLDAIGVCGGDCALDADADGICDDVDDCVGIVDACGVCNGPGAFLECGCTDIPEGDCDCDGNQVDAIGVCGGDCTTDEDCNGVCDNAEVPGCNIAQACNYDVLATQDDGSCEFISCLMFGCTDPTACNYDPAAQYDNGNCLTLDECGECGGPGAVRACGCSDIPEGDCDCDGNQTDALGVCGGTCEEDANVNGICDADEIMGCTVPEACNYQESATMNDGSCDFYGCVVFGCTDASSCSYNPEATYDNGTCLTPEECEGEEVLGCTYENAENYVADATLDDGTCIFNCEHPCGLNYDGNFDGEVGATDLINLLTEFGLECPED